MKKRRMTVVLCICAAVVLTSAVMLYRHFHIYNAEDFGFEDIKSPNDADGDGIDDYTDMVEGARAYIATDPQYKSAYYAGGYPTDGYGVCTDVVAQGLLSAGYERYGRCRY